MQKQSHEFYLKRAIEISQNAKDHGNTPFGALLVDEEGNILMEQENCEVSEKRCTGHAETALLERASNKYSKDFLWKCTLYSSVEPCCMCAGAMYWANVGKLVYGLSEKDLLAITGNNSQNPSFNIPCREIFAGGQKDVQVVGPFENLKQEIIEVHSGYWG